MLVIARLFGAFLGGVIFGIIPFLVARSRKQETLGVVALVCCIFGSLFMGLFLSVPLCLIFTVIAVVRKPPETAASAAPPAPGMGGPQPPKIG